MRTIELQRKLILAARLTPADDRVPYAFEKRIMARLAALPKVDVWAFWGPALWRAAAPCIAITLLLGFWTVYSANHRPVQEVRVLDLERTVLAPLDSLGELQ